MVGEHTTRSGALVATILSVKMEIDDDDRDVIEAHVEISNEANIPMGQLEAVVETTEGTSFHSLDPITSIGPGLTRTFVFNFSSLGGEWTFKLYHESTSGRRSLDLGPYHSDFELEKKEIGRKPKSSMGEGLFGGAFDLGMGDFGSVSERELIDSSTIELVDYEAEHDIGGGTRINVSEHNEAALTSPTEETSLIPPSQENSPTLLTTPTGPPETPPTSLSVLPTPPESPPAGPPSAPPTGPPSAPPAAPTGPPESPPAGPPSAPPSAPTGPPASPPAGPPSTPPETPTGPPAGPPSRPPAGPPSSPPQD